MPGRGNPSEGGIMEIKIKRVGEEQFLMNGWRYRTVTKVYFNDGSALTFADKLSRKEAIFNAYYQKGRDGGMNVEEAAVFAASKVPVR
jgi:hypothetical protein